MSDYSDGSGDTYFLGFGMAIICSLFIGFFLHVWGVVRGRHIENENIMLSAKEAGVAKRILNEETGTVYWAWITNKDEDNEEGKQLDSDLHRKTILAD